MTEAASAKPVILPNRKTKAKKMKHGVPVREIRTSIQVIGSTKHWLDQIIEEKGFPSYDAAIMYLVEERQRHLLSGFGSRPDLEEYICPGED